MRKTFQFKVAALCLVLVSQTVLAIGATPRRSQSSAIQGFPPNTNPFSPRKPTFSPFPKPAGVKPRETFENNKRLPGSFGSPQTELSKGNLSRAKVSCLQEAIDGGYGLTFDESSIWEFATESEGVSNALRQKSPLRTIKLPPAFAVNMCDQSGERGSCMALLSKSVSETPQAYYNSTLHEDSSIWNEVGAYLGIITGLDNEKPQDINQSLIDAEAKAQREGRSDPSLSVEGLTKLDPLIVATQLIIQKIDESLAFGNDDVALQGQALLKKINPSAAHGLSCLGLFKAELISESRLDGRKGSGIGPLSGMDYFKRREMANHSNSAMIGAIAAVAAVAIGVVSIIKQTVDHWQDSERADKADAREERAAFEQRIKDYRECKGSECDALYPDAAAAVKAAKNATPPAQGSIPTREDPENPTPADMFAPSIPQKNRPGSGGGSGELNSFDFDNSNQTPFGIAIKGSDDSRREDPEATTRFCNQVINKYKQFKNHKAQSSGRPIDQEERLSDPIPSGTGVARFDEWNSDFWADRKSRNRFGSENNNCNSLDRVDGL